MQQVIKAIFILPMLFSIGAALGAAPIGVLGALTAHVVEAVGAPPAVVSLTRVAFVFLAALCGVGAGIYSVYFVHRYEPGVDPFRGFEVQTGSDRSSASPSARAPTATAGPSKQENNP